MTAAGTLGRGSNSAPQPLTIRSSRMRDDRRARRPDSAQRRVGARAILHRPDPHAIQGRIARLHRHHECAGPHRAAAWHFRSAVASFGSCRSARPHCPDVGAPASEARGRAAVRAGADAAVGGSTTGFGGSLRGLRAAAQWRQAAAATPQALPDRWQRVVTRATTGPAVAPRAVPPGAAVHDCRRPPTWAACGRVAEVDRVGFDGRVVARLRCLAPRVSHGTGSGPPSISGIRMIAAAISTAWRRRPGVL